MEKLKKTPKTIVIIGNGIASWRVNMALEKKFIESDIIRIGSEDFAPKCSLRTTSINCLRGTKKNISKLGDQIVDSYNEFESFYQENLPTGVEKSFEYQLWEKEGPRASSWNKRFGAGEEVRTIEGLELKKSLQMNKSIAYLIEPKLFYLWHQERLKKTVHLDDFVTEVIKSKEGYFVKTHKGAEISADKVFICAGYLSHLFLDLVKDQKAIDYIKRCKPVRGGYMTAKANSSMKSFSLAYEKYHLIFRASDQTMMIGSTSEKDSALQLPMHKELNEILEAFKSLLKDPAIIPEKNRWEVVHGIRHKGAKRSPFWGELAPELYGVFGLYKNAFSFSFLAAKELV